MQTAPTLCNTDSAKQDRPLLTYATELWRSPLFAVTVLLTTLLSYGYYITHYSVSIDDLSGRFYVSGELLAQGRFTWTILGRFLKLFEHVPFFDAAFAILLMLTALTLICALFRKASDNAVGIGACAVFSCLNLSYPLACEAYSYAALPLYVSIGTLMAFGALYALYRAEGRWKPLGMLVACALLVLVCSLYESIAVVYVFLVFALLLLQLRHGTAPFHSLGGYLREGLRYAVPLIAAFLAEALISKALISLLQLSPSTNGANRILWAPGYIRICLSYITKGFLYNIIIKSLVYLPIGMLCVAMAAMLFYGIVDCLRGQRRLLKVLTYGGLFISIILLSLVRGVDTPYRTAQVYSLFVAFAGLLLTQRVAQAKPRKWMQALTLVLVALTIFFQASDLNHWFALDGQRYEKERADLVAIAQDVRRAQQGQDLPVVFVGHYQMDAYTADHITVTDPKMKQLINLLRGKIRLEPLDTIPITDTAVQSYLGYGTALFGDDRTIIDFCDYCGFRFQQGTPEMRQQALAAQPDMPVWPAAGSLLVTDTYIAVNLGK